jgi:hypothetical protein
MSPFHRTYLPNKRNTRKIIFRRSLAKNKKERQSRSSRRESGKQSNSDCLETVSEEFRKHYNKRENN